MKFADVVTFIKYLQSKQGPARTCPDYVTGATRETSNYISTDITTVLKIVVKNVNLELLLMPAKSVSFKKESDNSC